MKFTLVLSALKGHYADTGFGADNTAVCAEGDDADPVADGSCSIAISIVLSSEVIGGRDGGNNRCNDGDRKLGHDGRIVYSF